MRTKGDLLKNRNAVDYLYDFIAENLINKTDEEEEIHRQINAQAIRNIEEKERIKKWQNLKYR